MYGTCQLVNAYKNENWGYDYAAHIDDDLSSGSWNEDFSMNRNIQYALHEIFLDFFFFLTQKVPQW